MSRIRADQITNSSASGPPTVTNGLVVNNGLSVTGVITGILSGNIDGGTIVGTSASISGITTTSNLVVENSIFTTISTTDVNKTIVNREYCTVVTSSASTALNITVTLPASPQPGWEVGVAVGGTFLDTQVGRNGSNIMGLSENMVLNVAYVPVQLVYVDANVGWRFF
jgi:hypothetical protein